jgi:hypothetical protein
MERWEPQALERRDMQVSPSCVNHLTIADLQPRASSWVEEIQQMAAFTLLGTLVVSQ